MRLLRVIGLGLVLGAAAACGGGSGGGGGAAGAPTVYAGEIQDPTSPIVAIVAVRGTEESLGVLGTRSEDTSIRQVRQLLYVGPGGEAMTLEVGATGLPHTVSDAAGSRVLFSNYTGSSVNVALYDAQGAVIGGPEAVPVDPAELDGLTSRFLVLGKVTGERESAGIFSNSALALEFGLLTLSFVSCSTALGTFIGTGGLTAPVLVPLLGACGGILAGWLAGETMSSIDNDILLVADVVGCASLSPSNCLSLLALKLKELGALSDGQPVPPPPGASPFQGTMTGTWSGTCSQAGCPGSVFGAFSISVNVNGVVSGSYSGSDSGSITGSVSESGLAVLDATGSSGDGCTWTGQFFSAGGLSGVGAWNCALCNCSGNWSGS